MLGPAPPTLGPKIQGLSGSVLQMDLIILKVSCDFHAGGDFQQCFGPPPDARPIQEMDRFMTEAIVGNVFGPPPDARRIQETDMFMPEAILGNFFLPHLGNRN